MPELPEVDAIAGVARKYAVGNTITGIEIVRWNGKYFSAPDGPLMMGPWPVADVRRLGKQVVLSLSLPMRSYVVVHNAMTGYFDWEHEPWTFDYVEGKREAEEFDVRVKFHFLDGKVLRFHDARLFGSMKLVGDLPSTAPELIATPNGYADRPIMTIREFWDGLRVKTPVKVRLMDQTFLVGIGNIYSSEACHVAGIDPCRPSNSLLPEEVSVLHASLVWVVDHCIPQVRYDWLNVYRRTSCGTCSNAVTREELGGRSTFYCEECQS